MNNDTWPVVNVVYVGVNYDRLRCHWLPRLIGLTALTAHSFQLSNGAFVWMVINLTFHITHRTSDSTTNVAATPIFGGEGGVGN